MVLEGCVSTTLGNIRSKGKALMQELMAREKRVHSRKRKETKTHPSRKPSPKGLQRSAANENRQSKNLAEGQGCSSRAVVLATYFFSLSLTFFNSKERIFTVPAWKGKWEINEINEIRSTQSLVNSERALPVITGILACANQARCVSQGEDKSNKQEGPAEPGPWRPQRGSWRDRPQYHRWPGTPAALTWLGKKKKWGDRHIWYRSRKWCKERDHSYWELHSERTCFWARPPSLGQSVQVIERLQEITSFTYSHIIHVSTHSRWPDTYQMPIVWLKEIRNGCYPWGDDTHLGGPVRKERGVNIILNISYVPNYGFCLCDKYVGGKTIPILHMETLRLGLTMKVINPRSCDPEHWNQ